MHVFFSCGETSGDKYAATIVAKLISKQNITCSANGGQYVKSAGATLVCDVVSKSTIGFLEPILNLPFYLIVMRKTKHYILEQQVDTVVLIDHQGFNIPLAKWCKQNNIRVISLFAPQYWIWGKFSQAKKFVSYCDHICCVFKKEHAFYHQIDNAKVSYIGHPLIDLVTINTVSNSSVIGLFPGSRMQEIKHILPTMLDAAIRIKETYPNMSMQLAIASKDIEPYIQKTMNEKGIHIETSYDAYQLLSTVHCSIVASGTITLEHALMGVPCIVCYKMNIISYKIAMALIWKKMEEKCLDLFRYQIFY